MSLQTARVFPILLALVLGVAGTPSTDENAAIEWLEWYNTRAQDVYYKSSTASWAYNTNITDETQQRQVEVSLETSQFIKEVAQNATALWDWSDMSFDTKRKFDSITNIGSAALQNQTKLERLTNVQSAMRRIYSTAKVCETVNGQENCMVFEPDLTRELATGRDYDRLQFIWDGWRASVGPQLRSLYQEFVDLSNEAAVANGFDNTGASWRSWYEVDTFEQDLETIYEELKPLYLNLHAYVRRKLSETYGDRVSLTDPIPAHLFGNMWSQQWNNIFDLVEPYPSKPGGIDVTPKMVEQNYNATHMFRVSEEFFTSLGLGAMPDTFWERSMIVRPTDGRDVVCYASAWDFSRDRDFRIKQCTDVTMEDLLTVHHEMGHIQYYIQYADQPLIYRGGANPGFHEAVGDVLALSVATPKHLNQIGLLDEVAEDPDADINFLMATALEKIAFLPFGYLIDQWRWRVFDGSTGPDNYNAEWWKLRTKYQGIKPPSTRDETLFDPGCKFHIPNNTPYIRYFVSFVIQFQFHEALCREAGHTGPLHTCDIYRSTAAGDKLKAMLQMGTSKPWPEAMEAITGQRSMTASSLLKYFQPLTDWLKQKNWENREKLGWDAETWEDAKDPAASFASALQTTLPVMLLALMAAIFFRC
ncbi:angiotensin-converting enzyme-like [Branchiostoma floridae x Branchiostoma japonicum]